MENEQRERSLGGKNGESEAIKVSVVTIIWNVVLTLFKLIAGIIGNSGAMVSDAVHSASDVFATFIVIIGVKLAGRGADSEHPYGHERFECVAALILSAILFAVGIGIGYSGLMKIFGDGGELAAPGLLPLIAAIVSIVVKESMYWYTRYTAKKINSVALMAEAWHHRSDAFSSVGSFIGIFGARIGFPVLDPIASVIICFFIIKVAYDIFMEAINKMMDKACDKETTEAIRDIISRQEGVIGIDELRTRLFGDKIYVDIEIQAERQLTLEAAHGIAQRVHDAVEDSFESVKHCMVHVNPEAE